MDESAAKLKPMRWVAHLPLALLPFLAAAIDRPRLQHDLQRRVEVNLAKVGAGWAKVALNGRDIEIRGVAPDPAAVETARTTAAGTFGTRSVDMRSGTASP